MPSTRIAFLAVQSPSAWEDPGVGSRGRGLHCHWRLFMSLAILIECRPLACETDKGEEKGSLTPNARGR